MSNEIRLRDRWWYLNYTWHRWRLLKAAKSMAVHSQILSHMGVDLEKMKIEVRL